MINAKSTFLAIISSIFILIFSLDQSSFAVIAIYILFLFFGKFITIKNKNYSEIFVNIFSISSIFSIILYYVFFNNFGIPYNGVSDAITYEQDAKFFINNFSLFNYNSIRGGVTVSWHNSPAYIYIIGIFVKLSSYLGGYNTLIPRLFNSFLLGFIGIFVHKLASNFSLKPKTTFFITYISTLSPLMLWLSGQICRDIIVSFLIILFVYLWTTLYCRRATYQYFYLYFLNALCIIFLWDLRRPTCYIFFLITISSILLNPKTYKTKRLYYFLIPIIISGYLFFTFVDQKIFFNEILIIANDRFVSVSENKIIEGFGSNLTSIIFTTSLFPFGIFLRPIYLLASPLPVSFFSVDRLVISFGVLFQYFYIPYFLIGLRKLIFNDNWKFVVRTFILLFSSIAFLSFTVRHISQYFPLGVLISGYGYDKYEGSKFVIRFILVAFIIVLMSSYLGLKFNIL